MEILHTIITVLLIIYGSVTTYLVINMLLREEALEEFYETKTELLETQLVNVKIKVEETVVRLKEVDIRGSFEADDEVGFAFQDIKKLNEELLSFIVTYNQKSTENAEKAGTE